MGNTIYLSKGMWNSSKTKATHFLFILFFLQFWGCSSKIVPNASTQQITHLNSDTNLVIKNNAMLKGAKPIQLGIDVLQQSQFAVLKNKRVGLITNQTGVNSKLKSTIDILHETPEVNLISLFGPEHGVRGNNKGGKLLKHYIDKRTNLPVYSLYGKSHKPNKEMLKGLDVLVYDIQDIGVRSYTYISTMGLAIEAASEFGLDFIILDRPNPLGGKKVEGNIVEPEFISFIGQFPIPYVYGLTVGELAKLLVGEKMVKTSKDFNLKVIPMKNWNRNMTWEDTKLQWIPTSPHIPHSYSPFFYPMTGILGELRSAISIGVGYTLPFQIIGAEWINSSELANYLNNQNILGLYFRPITFKPYYAFGKGKDLQGVQIHITDYNKINLMATQFYIMCALKELYPENDLLTITSNSEIKMFYKAIGTDKIINLENKNTKLNDVKKFLNKDIDSFLRTSSQYFLYK